MLSGVTGMLQKQGSAEAVPAGRKRSGRLSLLLIAYHKIIKIANI
jgi:hypothetical protein